MKALKLSLAIILLAIAAVSQKAYADIIKTGGTGSGYDTSAVRKLELAIAEDRDKIIQENAAIKEDEWKLKEAEKIADRTKAQAIKEELGRDIARRKNTIKSLKKDISDMKDKRNDLVYGEGLIIPKRRSGE